MRSWRRHRVRAWALGAGGSVLAALAMATGALAATPVTFSYTGPVVPIPDGADLSGTSPGAPATADLPVSGLSSSVVDVDFRIDGTSCDAVAGSTTVGLDHSFVNDLELKLTSPTGTTVRVVDNTDGGGNNLCQVLLDDDAQGAPSIQSAVSAQAPFTGTWLPAEPLSAFDGEDPNGPWTFQAQDFFSSDIGNIRAFSIIVTAKTPTTIAANVPPDATVGNAISGTATVAGRINPTAGGTIDFRVYGPSDPSCTGTPAFTSLGVSQPTTDGPVQSAAFTPTQPGAYRWVATYSGDDENAASVTACNDPGTVVTVAKAEPQITGLASPANVTLGDPVADTAALRGAFNPAASVDFRLFGPQDPDCSQAPVFESLDRALDSQGEARSDQFTPAAPGTYRWQASFGGDDNNLAASTGCADPGQAVTVSNAPIEPPAGTCDGRAVTIVARPGVKTMGTDGDDVILGTTGNDRIFAGKGDDVVCGRIGNDRISGGPGKDRIRAGGGNDRLKLADGAADFAKCGPRGQDVASIDSRDQVKGCEDVRATP